MINNENILWYDCKHIGSFKIPWIKYMFDSNQLYIQGGIFNKFTKNIILTKISTIKFTQTFQQKMLNLSTLEIYTIGSSEVCAKIEDIENGDKVQELLLKIISEKGK